MKSSKMTGFGSVFKFTYTQSMKSKATLITLIIFCVVALLSFPVMSIIGGESEIEKSAIETIYVYEENINISENVEKILKESEEYKDVSIDVINEEELETVKNSRLKEAECMDVLVEIKCVEDVKSDEYGIGYRVYYSDSSALDSTEADNLAEFLSTNGSIIKYISVGIDEALAKVLSQYISYNVFSMDSEGNIISDGITEAQYGINYALLMITLLSITFAGSKVAEQIVTEKSSKVVEYILTSVKPMAIIVGKVFASLAVVFTILFSVIISFVVSGFINGIMLAGNGGSFVMPEIITSFFDSEVVVGANIITVIISAVIFIEGFIFYGFLGGVSGSMVSKVEELAEGTKLFTFAMLIGAYLALGLIMSSTMGGEGWGSLNYLVYFLPLSAPFIVPSYMLFGIISPLTGVLIILVNFVLVLALIWLVSRIYEQLIYHNGNPLKIKDLFRLSKTKGGNK